MLTKYQNGLGIDNKLKVSINGTSKYFIADHLGSTNALTDASGAILEQTAYDSFGNATNNLSTRYQYTGREFDNLTGLYFYRTRWYDANLGRFISEDSIGFKGGDINLYGYVKNVPLSRIDPLGQFGVCRDDDGSVAPCPPPQATRRLLNTASCAIEKYNPWLNGEFGGGFHMLGLPGINGGIGISINPLTQEICIYVKGCLRFGLGLYAGAGFKMGGNLGNRSGQDNGGLSVELGGDIQVPGARAGGRSGLIGSGISGALGTYGSVGPSVGIGPGIGVGISAGLDVCWTQNLICFNKPDKKCCQ